MTNGQITVAIESDLSNRFFGFDSSYTKLGPQQRFVEVPEKQIDYEHSSSHYRPCRVVPTTTVDMGTVMPRTELHFEVRLFDRP